MRRREAAAALILILPLALGGCWAQEDVAEVPVASTVPTTQVPIPTGSVAPFEYEGVTVTGPLGAEPTITLAEDFEAVDELDTADIVVGTGDELTADGTATIHYVGMGQISHEVFDSSWAAGQPATFDLAGVIPGFSQGLEGMKVGGRRLLIIPASLAYGEEGNPPIEPNETLVFVVDLLSVS